jgi:AcrR family transcriptional regulator
MVFFFVSDGREESSMAQTTQEKRVRGKRLHQLLMNAAIESTFRVGFRATSIEGIAADTGVAKTTIYRRWPNKAALIMDAFIMRVGEGTLFQPAERATDSIRRQMSLMAKSFRGKDGALVKALLAEAQFDGELATAFRERWTLPRREMAFAVFQNAIALGELRPDIDIEAAIDLFYAPMYYRLQMGTGLLSQAYIDEIFRQAMEGLSCD